MKAIAWVLIVVLAVSAGAIYIYAHYTSNTAGAADEFYFGVTCGFNTTRESEVLIDKVKNYTNLFIIDSWDVARNETMLNEICDYAANTNLKFIVYFDLISGTSPPLPPTYPWHMQWLTTAKARWDDKFLGIYLHDELGGKQLEEQRYVPNASDYADAANKFVQNIASYNSTRFAKNNSIPLFTSDYALYWWDYLGGYDTVFVELGVNHSDTQQISLCRGAANMQNKDWGAIIVWKYDQSPYLETAQEMYVHMQSAYDAGAKYVLVFDYKTYPEGNPYGILTEEHLEAMKNFHAYVEAHPRNVRANRRLGRFRHARQLRLGRKMARREHLGLMAGRQQSTANLDEHEQVNRQVRLSVGHRFRRRKTQPVGQVLHGLPME